jgi:hypothetical protein
LEEVAAHVLKNYLGSTHSKSIVFGTAKPGTFKEKIDELAQAINEGGGYRSLISGSVQANDDKLDAVAWVPFTDGRPGQMILFCQCKAGSSWDKLTSQLQPDVFIKRWMQDPFLVDPQRVFMVAESIDGTQWENICLGAGVMFDRCRIVEFCDHLSKDLYERIEIWTVAAKSSTASKKSGTASKKSGTASKKSGTASKKSGTASKKSGTASKKPGKKT